MEERPMKIYRVHSYTNGGESRGYTYYLTKRAAKIDAEESYEPGEEPSEIEELKVRLTREGILAFLNSYADHPNNG